MTIIPIHIFQKIDVMYTDLGKVKGIENSTKSTDQVKLISVIIHIL